MEPRNLGSTPLTRPCRTLARHRVLAGIRRSATIAASLLITALASAIAAGIAPAPASAQLPAPAVSSPHPIRFGAYGSLVFSHSTGDPAGTTDDIPAGDAAVLLSGTLGARFSYFLDLQAASWTDENWTGQHEEHRLNVARMYGEYTFSDAFRLRLGRFLTPVGQWNEIFAEPLTRTVLRPLTTYRPFAKSLTGLMAAGTVPVAGHDVGYAAYVSPPAWSVEEEEETGFLHAAGGRVAVELVPGLVVGTSVANFRVSRPYDADDPGYTGPLPGDTLESPAEEAREAEGEARWLWGLDASWESGRLELMAEATNLSGTALYPGERGAFIQAAYRAVGPLHLVARSEIYDAVGGQQVAVHTVGASARLFRHITLKLDRQFSSHPSERVRDGWFVSLSALF